MSPRTREHGARANEEEYEAEEGAGRGGREHRARASQEEQEGEEDPLRHRQRQEYHTCYTPNPRQQLCNSSPHGIVHYGHISIY